MLSTSTHVFSEIFLHINWHCKNNRPLISERVEPELYAFVREHCESTRGIRFQGIGGTETHVHLVVQIEPHLLISDQVGKLKGASSHRINEMFGRDTLQWQRGYGIVSFSARQLETVLEYVSTQKERHAKGTLNQTLESSGERGEDADPPVGKPR